MKWGVRRYQNKDGTLTPAGRKRKAKEEYKAELKKIKAESGGDRNKKIAKRVAAAALMTATATAAVIAYKKNPQAVRNLMSKVGNATVDGAKKAGRKTYDLGKKYIREAYNSAKDGVEAGIKKAPGKAAEAIVVGATMMAAKRMLDNVVGKEESARIFQANNNKKIGSFWKVSPDDRNDDD
jgi:hypothetical protein